MRERVLKAAGDAGRDPADITCVYNLDVRVDERAEPEPSVVAGSPGAVVERLGGFLEIGFTAMNILPAGPDLAEQAERLGRGPPRPPSRLTSAPLSRSAVR